jgi:hypothetical protein
MMSILLAIFYQITMIGLIYKFNEYLGLAYILHKCYAYYQTWNTYQVAWEIYKQNEKRRQDQDLDK